MDKFFNIDAPVIRALAKVGELMMFTALWFLCCLPVFTIGASTAALYRMMFQMRQDGSTKVSDFFRAFAQNFKRGTALWLIVILLAAALAVFYYLTALVESDIVRLVLLVVFCSLFLLSFILVVYVFPLTAYFENTVINTIRNAIGMGMGHLRQSIPACALCILPILAMVVFPNLFLRLLFLILMLVPGAVAYGIAGLLLPLFEKYSISAEDVEP